MEKIGHFLRSIFSLEGRDKSYLTFVEYARWWWTLLLFFFYLLVLGVSITIVALIRTPVLDGNPNFFFPFDTSGFFNGSLNLQVPVSGLQPANQLLSLRGSFVNLVYLQGIPQNQFGFSKPNLAYHIKVQAKTTGTYQTIVDGDYITTLNCPQGTARCSSMFIDIQPILFSDYQFTVTLQNGQNLLSQGLVGPQVSFSYTYTAQSYTSLAVAVRSIFVIFSILFCVAYLLVVFRRQQYLKWQSEQKFITTLLLVTVLYNNPVFFLEFLVPSWAFYFINSIFTVTFVTFLMLCVLVMVHSIITTPSERSFLWFYVPKFVICGILWAYVIVLIAVATFYMEGEYGYYGSLSFSNIAPFFYILIVLLLTYFGVLAFYVFRAVGKIRGLPWKRIKKLTFTSMFTVVILAIAIADIILFALAVQVGAIQYNVFFIAFNTYGFAMSILYFPAHEEEFKSQKEEEEERETMLRNDEEFERYE